MKHKPSPRSCLTARMRAADCSGRMLLPRHTPPARVSGSVRRLKSDRQAGSFSTGVTLSRARYSHQPNIKQSEIVWIDFVDRNDQDCEMRSLSQRPGRPLQRNEPLMLSRSEMDRSRKATLNLEDSGNAGDVWLFSSSTTHAPGEDLERTDQ